MALSIKGFIENQHVAATWQFKVIRGKDRSRVAV